MLHVKLVAKLEEKLMMSEKRLSKLWLTCSCIEQICTKGVCSGVSSEAKVNKQLRQWKNVM